MTPSAIYTPLRYPGGKAKLGPFLSGVIKANRLSDGVYAEPYAGGAGAAMFLLFRGFVRRVRLNDIDRAVVAFWRAITGSRSEEFARRIEKVPLSVAEWDRQRAIYVNSSSRGYDLGFAFFYLNRTNRSGIMNAGIIGGRQQKGEWGIAARFNRADLASRVRAVGRMSRHVAITRHDAMEFVREVVAERAPRTLLYLDPPYYQKGHQLYTNFYGPQDHQSIAATIRRLKLPWLLTYDDCSEIRRFYKGCAIYDSELSYSARDVRRGREVVVTPKSLRLPPRSHLPRSHQPGFELLRS